MNIWPQLTIPLKSAVRHTEDTQKGLADDSVQKVRDVLATMGSSLTEPVQLGGEDGRMLALIVLGPDVVTKGSSLLLRVTNELSRHNPVLRLKVVPCGSTGPDRRSPLSPHEVGAKLDALEQQLRTALGDAVATSYGDED